VAEEVAGKLVLFNQVARSVVLVGRLVVGEFPFGEVIGSDREPERCGAKPLADTNL
jgi:hypothetical protein